MRTPSLTKHEAEAAIGPRELARVTSDNVHAFRKWLTAQGMSGSFAATLNYSDLLASYLADDISGLRNRETQWQAEKAIPAPVNGYSVNGHASNAGSQDQIQRIAALLGELLAKPQGVDEPAVIGIARTVVDAFVEDKLPDLIAQHSPVTRIEVKAADGTVRAIDGHAHSMVPTLIALVSQSVHVCIVGPAGGGKSTACEQVAHALGLRFFIQGAASGSHEYLGYKDGAGQYHTTAFREAFENGGLFCAEELDSGSPDVPLVLNAALANGHLAFPDSPVPVKRHPDFRIVANANTYGQGADRVYVGRTQLDGATIDRFAMVDWQYDTTLERKLAGNDAWVDRVQALRRGAARANHRIIISPRASINGAKMIAAGWSHEQAETAFIWKGLPQDQRDKITAAAH